MKKFSTFFAALAVMILGSFSFVHADAGTEQTAVNTKALRLSLGAISTSDTAVKLSLGLVQADTASLRLSLGAIKTDTAALRLSLAPTFVTQSFSLAAAGIGTPLTLIAPVSTFGFQIATVTGTTLINWDAYLQGSLNGVTYTSLVSHSYAAGTEGSTVWTSDKPVMYLRSRMVALTLGGESTGVMMNLLGK